MGLRNYVSKRLASSLVLLVLAMSFNFYLFMVMPGDPVDLFVPPRGLPYDQYLRIIALFKSRWGLDQPFHMQYLTYLKNMFTWNFGSSIVNGESVAGGILYRLPWTVLLMGGSAVASVLIGVAMGVLIAHKRGSKLDMFSITSALVTGSMPTFWVGMILILVFTTTLKWFPSAHAWPPEWGVTVPWPQALVTLVTQSGNNVTAAFQLNGEGLISLASGYIRHAFLPVLTLSIFQFGGFLLLVRTTMLDSLTEDYIVTAKAKGVSQASILYKHALKNASLPLITTVALTMGFMLSGAVITETVYSWPGLGDWIFRAVGAKDYFSMQAVFYIVSVCVIIANALADLLYGVVDPRIKYT